MKKYFRTQEHIYKRLFVDKAIINELGTGACDKDLNPIGETIIKESDNLNDLVLENDLLIVEDRTTCYPYMTFPLIYDNQRPFAYNCVIFKLKELYIKNKQGDYMKVLDTNKKGELDLK